MLSTIWSPKGGSGCTVVAAALALTISEQRGSAVLVDLVGDLPAALGIPEPDTPGVTDWLAADDGDREALGRLCVPIGHGVDLLPVGSEDVWSAEREELLSSLLAEWPVAVVVDAGVLGTGTRHTPVTGIGRRLAGAGTSLMVLRPCYLALRRAVGVGAGGGAGADGIILVVEPGRSLDRRDVADLLDVPVVATVEVDPAVARSVDAGLLARRLPRTLQRSLRNAA